MFYHILLTETCNSQCRYCYKKSFEEFDNQLGEKFEFDFNSPEKSQVSIEKLRKFIKKDDTIIFYGGEPLMEIEKIVEIMDTIDVRYRMQTNGKLLDRLPEKYVNRIGKILISLDGDEERTDYNRGKGTWKKVMENIKRIRKNGYAGELIARMCISPDFPDIDLQVKNLIDAGFTSVHWQIDAGFYKFDYDFDKFSGFVEEYNRNIGKLVEYWIKDMKANRRVLMLYPFIGIMNDILNKNKTKLRCGAGYAGYAITTNGKIVACPIMNCIKNFEAGDLDSEKLKKFEIRHEDCKKCKDFDLCGGRCLYWREAGLWNKEGDELICRTIKHLISELKNRKEITELIHQGIIDTNDFNYERYFGPEIIP